MSYHYHDTHMFFNYFHSIYNHPEADRISHVQSYSHFCDGDVLKYPYSIKKKRHNGRNVIDNADIISYCSIRL